tara:strand:+ start:12 stop:1877 length:1866 start_codon:yes stop_codon:yes gene_type:complete
MVTVHRKHEINLFGTRYPIMGAVQQQSAAQWAQKQVIGDWSKDSETPMSSWIMSDASGGVGIKDIIEQLHGDRCWWSTAEIGYRGHNLLPRLVTQASTNPGTSHPEVIVDYANELYVAFGTDLRKWNNVTSAWSSSLGTLIATPTHGFVHKDKLYFACGSDFNRYDGSTLTTGAVLGSAQACRYLSEWDDRLFTLDNDGQLDYSLDEGVTWTANALSTLPAGYFTSLFEYRTAAGTRVLYMGTKVGLYELNFDNGVWVRTDLTLPFHAYGGLGAAVRRDTAFISAGLAVYGYVSGNPADITIIGPDLDAGLPSDYRGSIIKLVAGINHLFAFVDATAAETPDLFMAGDDEYGNLQFPDVTGFSLVLKWNGRGWGVVYTSGTADKALKDGVVSNANDTYRLWFGVGNEVFYVPLESTIQNPLEVQDYEFAASDTHITGWFDADNAVIDKLAAYLTVYLASTSADEYAKFYYGLDYDEDTWTLLTNNSFTDGQVDADGETVFDFASGAGLDFKAIRFKWDKVRGSTSTLSPDVRWGRLSYLKNLDLRWGFQVVVDCRRNYRFKTARSLLSALKTAKTTGTLGNFTFKNGRGAETHRCRIMEMKDVEIGGRKSEGVVTLDLFAP